MLTDRLLRSRERGGDAGERGLEARADARDGGDNNNRDESGDQAVLNCGSTGFVP
jgi:hypothetical protein